MLITFNQEDMSDSEFSCQIRIDDENEIDDEKEKEIIENFNLEQKSIILIEEKFGANLQRKHMSENVAAAVDLTLFFAAGTDVCTSV